MLAVLQHVLVEAPLDVDTFPCDKCGVEGLDKQRILPHTAGQDWVNAITISRVRRGSFDLAWIRTGCGVRSVSLQHPSQENEVGGLIGTDAQFCVQSRTLAVDAVLVVLGGTVSKVHAFPERRNSAPPLVKARVYQCLNELGGRAVKQQLLIHLGGQCLAMNLPTKEAIRRNGLGRNVGPELNDRLVRVVQRGARVL